MCLLTFQMFVVPSCSWSSMLVSICWGKYFPKFWRIKVNCEISWAVLLRIQVVQGDPDDLNPQSHCLYSQTVQEDSSLYRMTLKRKALWLFEISVISHLVTQPYGLKDLVFTLKVFVTVCHSPSWWWWWQLTASDAVFFCIRCFMQGRVTQQYRPNVTWSNIKRMNSGWSLCCWTNVVMEAR